MFGPAFKEQKQQSADTNGQPEASPSLENAILPAEKAPVTTTADEHSAETVIHEPSAKKLLDALIWPSLPSKWSWKDFWREADRTLIERAESDSRHHKSQSTRSEAQFKEHVNLPNKPLP